MQSTLYWWRILIAAPWALAAFAVTAQQAQEAGTQTKSVDQHVESHDSDAQSKTPTTNPAVLSTIHVRAKSLSTLPDHARLDGPFGPSRSLLDTPRSVTPINQELQRQAGINGLGDIQKIAPDTYAPNTFGAQSLPEIRGQLGEIFEDGLRRQGGNNGFGLPLSFNGIEQIDVVKGPPPVVLGSTQRVGGFVNLMPKRPDLDRAQGFGEISAGSWNGYRGQLDYSTPITPGRSAFRVSAEDREEGSYYDYAHYKSHDLYMAYAVKPDADSRFDVNIEYLHIDFKDIAGINRATQALIDHGTYITGQGVQPNGSTVPGAFAVISPTGTVQLPRHRVLTDPRDVDTDTTVLANTRYQHTLGDNAQFYDRAIYQHLSRNEVANDSFVEIIKGADTFENRGELVFDYDFHLFGLAAHDQSDVGIDVRYNHVVGYSQFDTEADNAVDLTGPLQNRRIALTPAQQAQLVLLRPGVYVSPGAQYDANGDGVGDYLLSDTTGSDSYQTGLFYQHDIRFDAHWSSLFGVRGDYYDVHAKDPLPPPGFKPAEDSIGRLLGGANGALTWKPISSVAIYLADSFSQSTSNSIGGGTALGANNKIDPLNFATDSRLYELGIKYGPEKSPWYADAAAFQQTRSLRNRNGSNSGIKTRGIETQIFYRPDSHLFANIGAGYLDARYDHSSAFQDTRVVNDAFDDSRPDIIVGTGIGSPNFAAFPPSTRRLQGLPHVLVSALATYQFDDGFGTALSVVYTSSFPLDYLATVVIPDQYTLNAAAYYRWETVGTEVRLDVYNLTDRKNFSAVFDGGYFGATDVFPSEPIHFMISLRQRF